MLVTLESLLTSCSPHCTQKFDNTNGGPRPILHPSESSLVIDRRTHVALSMFYMSTLLGVDHESVHS